jgi:hypothetical protein
VRHSKSILAVDSFFKEPTIRGPRRSSNQPTNRHDRSRNSGSPSSLNWRTDNDRHCWSHRQTPAQKIVPSLLSDLQRDRPTVPTCQEPSAIPSDLQCQNRSRQSANLDDLGFEEIPLPPPGPGQIQGCARRHQHQLPGPNRSPWHSIHPRQEYLQ